MPRFFVPDENFSEGSVTVTGDDARHIARSLRMAVGDGITVCDLMANEYECRLVKIRDDACECEIISSRKGETEARAKISLFVGYPKSDKLEYIVQKAVELGASEICPFESSRCIKRPKADRADKLLMRLSRIAEEAAKQCGRSKIPKICQALSYAEAIRAAAESELALFCYEGDGTRSLRAILENNRGVGSISVVVGSEGGFSGAEAKAAEEAGLIPTNLGPRILRCETAPIYALSAISYATELSD